MSSEKVIIIASFVPKPGHEEAVENILREVAKGTRGEPGNEIYDLFGGPDAEGRATFHLFERYRDQTAVQAHREAEHYKAYRARIQEHLAEPIKAYILKAVDTAG